MFDAHGREKGRLGRERIEVPGNAFFQGPGAGLDAPELLPKRGDLLAKPLVVLCEPLVLFPKRLEFHTSLSKAAADPSDKERVIETVADLTFGEYLRLVQQPTNWTNLGWKLDRAVVLEALDEVREIRNDVMHYSPDPIKDLAVERLRTFAAFLRPLL